MNKFVNQSFTDLTLRFDNFFEGFGRLERYASQEYSTEILIKLGHIRPFLLESP